MELSKGLLSELQKRLKVGNRRGVHLNAIPQRSRYKFDFFRLSHIDTDLPKRFLNQLLSDKNFKFRISWKDNVPDLNTLFDEEKVQLTKITSALDNLINQTETIESEKGINTFGFGFPILVRRDKQDSKLTVAPVLIWSLKIRTTKEFNTWEIVRSEEDPVYLNEVLLNHLRNDIDVEIDQLSNDILEDGLIDKAELINICADLLSKINPSVSPGIIDDLNKGLNDIHFIKDKPYYEKLPLNSTNSFIEFSGLFSLFEVQKQNIIKDYENLLALEGYSIPLGEYPNEDFQTITSVETDPTQQGVLTSIKSKRNILIQGPPGTGKSQTLTAILINALENNKKTIVVCEKKTALDVLHKSLISKDLGLFCTLIKEINTDRKTVVESVRVRTDNSNYRSINYVSRKENLEAVLSPIHQLINSLNQKHKKLASEILGSKNWTQVVGMLLKENTGFDFKDEVTENIFSYDYTEYVSFSGLIEKAESLYYKWEPHQGLSFLHPEKFSHPNLFELEKSLETDCSHYLNEIETLKKLESLTEQQYFDLRNNEFTTEKNEILTAINQVKTILGEYESVYTDQEKMYTSWKLSKYTREYEIIKHHQSIIESVLTENVALQYYKDDKKVNSTFFKFLAVFLPKHKKAIQVNKELHTLISDFQYATFSFSEIKSASFEGQLNNKLQETEHYFSQLEQQHKSRESVYKSVFHDLGLKKLKTDITDNFITGIKQLITLLDHKFDEKELLAEIKNTFSSYRSQIADAYNLLTESLKRAKNIKSSIEFTDNIIQNEELIAGLKENLNSQQKTFSESLKSEFNEQKIESENTRLSGLATFPVLIDRATQLHERVKNDSWKKGGWVFNNLHDFLDELLRFIKQKQEYLSGEEDYFKIEYNWFNYFNGLPPALKVITGKLSGKKNWVKCFRSIYLNKLLLKYSDNNLPSDDQDYTDFDTNFSALGNEQLNFIKHHWFAKQTQACNEFRYNKNLSVENLYNKKSSPNFKRLSLRQIVQYDSDLFTTFFPVVLTTPDVASTLFKGMNQYFDIVLFDEASQLRLEDNLPALLKGKQIIIAGDEHQMPPSNYFSKIFDGSAEDEEELEEEELKVRGVDINDILLSCDSLLEFGTELDFSKRYLDFHYRSRHPYLIDFSNFAFYNQRLKPLPNTFEYTPISYIPVDGTFSEHTNEAEAEMVLEIIEKNIQRLPDGNYPSVGVATFNITQRDLIKTKISERRKLAKYTDFDKKIQELEANGLFIKNLENIQGDERDIIILSTTYGPNKDGRFAHRFGPLNYSKGYKLLNVIITRAKYKIYLCSSIPEEVFLDYKSYLVTEKANNKRAILFSYLAYAKAVSEQNNEDRIAVLTALAENTSVSVSFDSFRGMDLESPFEEEVYQFLVTKFGTENLIAQLQYAGFRIDIVFDSGIAGIPKIAIECDGAKYHSSEEAYLYDLHRQRILEDHGFVFHRIWSTNWWRNQSREENKILKFIEQIVEKGSVSNESGADYSFAFKNNIVVKKPERHVVKNKVEDTETIISVEEPHEQKFEKGRITKLSKVKFRYLNTQQEMTINLVIDEHLKKEKTGNIQNVFYKSPLGVAIQGHMVGDVVKVGMQENYIEILSVEN